MNFGTRVPIIQNRNIGFKGKLIIENGVWERYPTFRPHVVSPAGRCMETNNDLM
jgi:hypothetical protein